MYIWTQRHAFLNLAPVFQSFFKIFVSISVFLSSLQLCLPLVRQTWENWPHLFFLTSHCEANWNLLSSCLFAETAFQPPSCLWMLRSGVFEAIRALSMWTILFFLAHSLHFTWLCCLLVFLFFHWLHLLLSPYSFLDLRLPRDTVSLVSDCISNYLLDSHLDVSEELKPHCVPNTQATLLPCSLA